MKASKAFRCKNIYTAKSENLIDGYVITEGNRILAVGDEAFSRNYIDSDTEIINIADGFIMPGIHDYHVHLMGGAMMERDGDLRTADSEEEAARMLAEKCGNKKQEWVLANAWDHFRWPGCKLPDKKTLDKYFPDTPVFLLNKESHGAWVNSRLLEIFGITRDTPDPKDGSYSRYDNGEPSGYLHEAAFFPVLDKIYRGLSDEEITGSIKAFQSKANRYGITSIGDVSMFGITYEKAYSKLDASDGLSVRIHFSKDIFSDIEAVRAAKREYSGPMVRFDGVKGFIDGTPMGHSGYMLEPYSDMPNYRGAPLIEPDMLFKMVQELDREGIHIRIHACGDAGVRLCLDAFENAVKMNGQRNLHHCIEHIECTTPEDVSRFGKIGVIPSIQPDHMPKYNFADHCFHTIIGEERMKYCWPFKSLLDSAGALAYGSDFTVAPLMFTRGVWRAVHRTTDDGEPKGGWNPEERLTVHEALQSCTSGAALAAGRSNDLGTIEAGKFADLAIFDDNIFEIIDDRDKMLDTEARMTVLDGKIVFQR